MHESPFIGQLLLLIAVATAGAALFERLRLPGVAGFLVMGAVVGPGGLGLVDDADRVRELAELGVVFLLFEIGLELPLDRVRRLWRGALLAGGLQVALTVAGVALAAVSLGVSVPRALLLGGLVAMSSTALVMGVLSARGEIDSPQGQLSIGILLFQDLCIVPFLLLVPLLATGGDLTGDALWATGRTVLALVAFFPVARFVLPRLLDRVVTTGTRDLFTLVAFLIVLGTAWAAGEVGLTLAVGAFVGGLVLSASPFAHQLFVEVAPLRGVLLGIFFTAVGMLLDLELAIEGWSAVLVYVLAVVLFKAGVVAVIVGGVLRHGLRLGIVTGLGLAQTGEFSFVLAGAAAASGLLDPTLQQVFVAGSILTLLATPGLFTAGPAVARVLSSGRERRAGAGEGLGGVRRRDHVVLLGFGLAGQSLARVFRSRGIEYVGADANPARVQELRSRDEPVIFGDVSRAGLLTRLGVREARLVVVAVSDSIATREAVRLVRELAPDVPVVARTRFVLDVDPLYGSGASAVVAEEFESTLEVLSRCLGVFGTPEAAIAHFTAELREEGYEPMRTPSLALDPWLGEILEEVSTDWIEVEGDPGPDATLGALDIRARVGCSILALEHHGSLYPNPDPIQPVRRGDRLLAFGRPREFEKLAALFRDQEASAGSGSERISTQSPK